MANETAIQEQLQQQFPYMKDKIRIARERRLFADVPVANLAEVFDHLVRRMDFSILCTITGLDLGASLGVIYHLARPSGEVFNLSTSVDKAAPTLQTVISYFPAAEAYERELVDLLGMQVQGLPPGTRYPLNDDWPVGQYPLRKDWTPPAAPAATPAAPPDATQKGSTDHA